MRTCISQGCRVAGLQGCGCGVLSPFPFLPTTHHSPLTLPLSLFTDYSPLTTHHSPLTTQYVLRAACCALLY